jgi:putative chitinase
MASMWFWQTHGLNELADRDDGGKMGEDIVRQITKRVNGGQNGIAQRLFYYRRFKKELGL